MPGETEPKEGTYEQQSSAAVVKVVDEGDDRPE
jgi:hypothetical protein